MLRLVDCYFERYENASCTTITHRFKLDLNEELILIISSRLLELLSEGRTIDELYSVCLDAIYINDELVKNLESASEKTNAIALNITGLKEKTTAYSNQEHQYNANLHFTHLIWKVPERKYDPQIEENFLNLPSAKSSDDLTQDITLPIISEKYASFLCYRQYLKTASYKEARGAEAAGAVGSGAEKTGYFEKRDMVGASKPGGTIKSLQQNVRLIDIIGKNDIYILP